MPTANFYLKKPETTTKKSLIYLQFKYSGQKLTFSTGQTIDPKNWNSKKQRVKSNIQTTSDGKHSLNDLLDNLKLICEKTYNNELGNGIPSKEVIKKQLQAFMNKNNKPVITTSLKTLIERFIRGEIKHNGGSKKANTLKTYRTFYGHLVAFEDHFKVNIDFDSITLDFYYKYVSFLENTIVIKPNSIAKDVQIIKTIMNEAVDQGLTSNMQYKHKKFAVKRRESDSVYLNERELSRLYKFDLTAYPKLEAVRDLFVFGANVGLRFSDYSNIKPEHIVEQNGAKDIKLYTQKTGELVIIPCNRIVLEILNKYKHNFNCLPQIQGNTIDAKNALFNKLLKEACRMAGFTEKKRLSTNPELELWQCIGSHTARRSYATNLYIRNVPTYDIMKITGHRTEKAFMKYIRIDKTHTAQRVREHVEKTLSIESLSVA